ncbi:MAG TPA: hypothetical protein VKX17_16300 [Planctomycetota bacterium]|nr:hypothetical protein [Planctomycetota bacterium]
MASAELGPGLLNYLFQAVNWFCQPVYFYTGTTIAFFGALKFRKFLVKPVIAASIGILGLVFISVSLFNEQFRREATKSDNAPIWIMLGISSICMWAAFWQAVNNDERFKKGLKSDEHDAAQEKLHVWPYLVYLEGVIAAFVMALLFIWSLGLDAPLEMFANPAKSPNPAKAPWYFLGLQELLVYYDPWIAGVLLPGMIIVGLIALPYCDPNPKGVGYYTFNQRKFAITTYLFGYVMMWLVLIFVGTFLRGQNWNFFGLYEQWDAHKVIAANNVNVSDVFWQYIMHRDPKALDIPWYKREVAGFAILLVYFTVVPFLVTKIFKNFYNSFITTYGKIPGLIRYSIVIMFLLVMLAVPIKMYLRWAFTLKYIVFIPEYFFNI